MKIELLGLLRCPLTGQALHLETVIKDSLEIYDNVLVSDDGNQRYSVHKGIPRFVEDSNYADNFGMQWNHFRRTQLDSHSGHPISSERFWLATGWKPEQLKDKWVLDAGCGAGRFAEVALIAGAKVVALDYSSAVDACYENLKQHPNLHVVQGDIYHLPFAVESFSFVYSLGVLQHTPDVENAFASLPPMLKKGGALCADFYWKRFRTMLHTKYLLRPITKRMDQSLLFTILKKITPYLLLVSQTLGRVPFFGPGLKRIIPVADYTGRYALNAEQMREWALLDTFDMLAPTYDNPQKSSTIRLWFQKAGMEDIQIGHWGHLAGRGVKPLSKAN